MESICIADTDVVIPRLGLGTVELGRDQQVRYPRPFVIPDDRQAKALLDLAWELGVTLLDAAPAYGNAEERLGRLLRGARRRWTLCTKVGEEFSDGRSRYDYRPEAVRASLERSLRRLETERIDIALVHSNGDDLEIIERYGILEQLADLKRAGLIGAFGMSVKTVAGGLLAAQRSDVVMVSYNLEERDAATVLDYCHAHNRGALIKKGFGSGHLCAADNRNGDDPIQKSMDFLFAHPGVGSVILGTINPDHLRQNVAAALRAIAAAPAARQASASRQASATRQMAKPSAP